ncbi:MULTISPECIES: hypothetical protein [unclassified Kaistella]|uniref:hypothetical protein n=1 Tax=unclassified Kaistella TaxID=2762626 RepID=UPI002733E9DD|nr:MULTISPECIES: hypothetical protein [unclassified Kaistella]MCZ2082663.1 hypothetical protein [Flavobacteriales bacterium]MDP2454303.1 hypothetical protein [Kaistella sp. SH11-4b]MDP2457626.1 hypothetical protein [Kaistella sp. SH40-3]MDP2460384.1 hypothetical protein [Kaistella sp. SH19-2b]
MKTKFIFLLFISLFLYSCGSDDDICIGGEATPRMKVKFKTKATGKMKTMDSLFIAVDYGTGPIPVYGIVGKTDSVLIPLRVDETPFTKMYVGVSRAAVNSQIKINYSTVSEYVSPACGIKKLYQNVNSELEVPNSVLGVEQNQTQIIDENKTHLFLLF